MGRYLAWLLKVVNRYLLIVAHYWPVLVVCLFGSKHLWSLQSYVVPRWSPCLNAEAAGRTFRGGRSARQLGTRAARAVVRVWSSVFHTAGVKYATCYVRRAIAGLDVPIGAILKNDHSFGPEDIASLTAAFEAALASLGLTDRKDPLTTAVAKAIIKLAKDGERDPERLRDGALRSLGT